MTSTPSDLHENSLNSRVHADLVVGLSPASASSTPLCYQPQVSEVKERTTHGSSGISVVGDLSLNFGKGFRVLDLDTLLLEEGNRLVERPVLVDGCWWRTRLAKGMRGRRNLGKK